MATIDRNTAPTSDEVEAFLVQVEFNLPKGFIEFFKEANGADISTDERYVVLWALTEMVQLNKEYTLQSMLPNFLFLVLMVEIPLLR